MVIYAALILVENKAIVNIGINDIISLINKQFPNNYLIIKEYIDNGDSENLIYFINNFINLYPNDNRVIISGTTTQLKIISEYIYSLGLSIPSISYAATSPLVRSLKNVLTYAPIDKYSAMCQFLIYKDYKMEQIKILYNPNTDNDIFVKTYIEQIKVQADLLNISYDIENLQEGKNFYNILPKSLILIMSDSASLKNSFVNDIFLNSIPAECYISLSDFNLDIGDIFGNIPAFVITSYPIDYTETSTIVYNSLTNKNSNFYIVYSFYDILYSLIYFTGTNLPLTLENYISVNPFQSGVFPAFIAAQSNLDLKINGIDFGQYMAIFTKNSLVQNDDLLYLKYNQGGVLSLPESNSIFKTVGIVPFFNINIFYGDENYYNIYDECGNLIVTRFDSNITINPLKNNSFFNIGQQCNNKFYCKYSPDNYFSYLEATTDAFNNNSVVNLTMGKIPILKYIPR